jgi:hypothetical protein
MLIFLLKWHILSSIVIFIVYIDTAKVMCVCVNATRWHFVLFPFFLIKS